MVRNPNGERRMTGAERQARVRERHLREGRSQYSFWLKPQHVDEVRAFGNKLNEQSECETFAVAEKGLSLNREPYRTSFEPEPGQNLEMIMLDGKPV